MALLPIYAPQHAVMFESLVNSYGSLDRDMTLHPIHLKAKTRQDSISSLISPFT